MWLTLELRIPALLSSRLVCVRHRCTSVLLWPPLCCVPTTVGSCVGLCRVLSPASVTIKRETEGMFHKSPPHPPHPTGVEQPCEDTVTQPQTSGCRAAAAQRRFRLLFISEGDATMSASNIKHAVITLNQRLASDGAASERSDSSHITDERTSPIPAPGKHGDPK